MASFIITRRIKYCCLLYFTLINNYYNRHPPQEQPLSIRKDLPPVAVTGLMNVIFPSTVLFMKGKKYLQFSKNSSHNYFLCVIIKIVRKVMVIEGLFFKTKSPYFLR